ncbi:LVIVD repeat-containing protein [Nocardioides sp. NPDC058538]|uniref:LVIVD repeat-containing protein n=1 Tax=Nocardioides sp. NPDC058538 TaxID=3346542 RepID=UPI00365A6ADB
MLTSDSTPQSRTHRATVPASRWRRRLHLLLTVALGVTPVAVALCAPVMSDDTALVTSQPTVFPERTAVPQRPCQPGDRPETGMQGRVPKEDLLSGRAAQGYTCNLRSVGRFPTTSAASFDVYQDCAYVARQLGAGGVQVLDVSDPANPRPTDTLATPAMLDPWESLRVNAKRGLLAAAGEYKPYVDIYDISGDCRRPRLLSTAPILPGKGHEGWFSPDGNTYYVSTTRTHEGAGMTPTLFPVDVSDPANPRTLSSWTFNTQTHGGATTEDGTRSYACQQDAPPKDALTVLDTTAIAERASSPQPRVLAEVTLGDNQWCQGAYRVTYDGHPYLIQYGERSGSADCSRAGDNWATFGYPRIFDLADESHPRLVSSALLESALPQHCAEVTGEGAANGLGYSVHHCAPDRLYDPTILVCSWFGAGLRVLDIRDPKHPVELAYFNPGVNGALGTAARPVVRAERGEIWFAHDISGFYALRFENDVWPFDGSDPCPEYDDYYFSHYNPMSSCPTANFDGIGEPAPAAPRYRAPTS